MYIVEITEGNGYRCSCCRHESTEEFEFHSLKDAERFVANKQFQISNYDRLKAVGLSKIDEDTYISSFHRVYEEEPDEESEFIKSAMADMEKELYEAESKAKKAAARKKAAAKKAAETKRRELYDEMKKEYEEVK